MKQNASSNVTLQQLVNRLNNHSTASHSFPFPSDPPVPLDLCFVPVESFSHPVDLYSSPVVHVTQSEVQSTDPVSIT